MSYFLFVLNNFLAAWVASSLSLLTIGGNKPYKKILAALAGFPVVITVVLLILGTIGKLSAVWASFLLIPSVVILHLIQKRQAQVYFQSRKPSGNRLSLYLSIGLLAGVLGVFIYQTSMTGTHFGWDDFNHHAAVAGHWLKDQRLSLAPFGFQAYYPHNAELISLWFMLPFQSDALAGLSGLYWGTLTAAATLVLVFLQTGLLSVSAVLAALLLSSTIVLRSALTFCAVDLAGPAMTLAALALIVPSSDQEPKGRSPAEIWYGGLFSGFALGCKVSFVYVPVIIFLYLLLNKQPKPDKIKETGLFFSGVLVTGSYWYIRNFLLTGNPVFPAELGPFQGPFSEIAQSRTQLISWILSGSTGCREWWVLMKRYINWPYGLGLLAVFGYGTVGCQWLKQRTLNSKNIQPATIWLFITGLTALFLYPFIPFSGTVNLPNAPLAAFPRYLITPFALGLILFSSLLKENFSKRKPWPLLFGAITTITLYGYFSHYVNKSTIAIGMLLPVYFFYKKNFFKTNRRMANSALLLVALCALALGKPRSQKLTDARVYNYRREDVCPNIGEAWRFLETLPEGADLESSGTISKQYYPLFGRKFQFNLKRIEYKPMHEYWRRGTFWDYWGGSEKSSYYRHREYDNFTTPSLISKLIGEKVEYVLVSRIGLHKWPLELSGLASSNRVQRIYADPCTVIWRIIPEDER